MVFGYPDALAVALVGLVAGFGVRFAVRRHERAHASMEKAVGIVRERRAREQLQREKPRPYAALVKLFFEVDPAGVNASVTADEYDPEVGSVLPRLAQAYSVGDVEKILREEFDRWFDSSSYDRQALATLAARVWSFWQSPEMQTRRVIEDLEAEVNNGGFNQYFFNSSGIDAEAAIGALERVGARRTADIVRLACSRFPDGQPPRDRSKRQSVLESIDPDGTVFADEDRAFWAYREDLAELLRDHEARVTFTDAD